MPKLNDLIRSVRDSTNYRRAQALAANDYKLIADLVEVRKQNGLKQQDVADLLGISQQAVSKIESHDSDPKLSTLRMYANAIGALVAHAVEPDTGQLENEKYSIVAYYVAPRTQGKTTTFTYVTAPAKRLNFALVA